MDAHLYWLDTSTACEAQNVSQSSFLTWSLHPVVYCLPFPNFPECPTLCSSTGRQRAFVCTPALMPRSHAPATSLLLRTFVFGTHLLLRERASHNKTKIASVCVCLDSCLCVCVCLDSCICVLCCLAIVSHTKCTSCTRFLAVLISFALE